MPLKITAVYPGSQAAEAGILPDDIILTINSNHVRDVLDYRFYSAESELEIIFRRKQIEHSVSLIRSWETPLGIETEDLKCRTCINNCIFCFVDQMRPGIRPSLYVKDDDFRFSFLLGNYITLTNISEADFQRIIQQRLSPLYVSVHTANSQLHKKMFRYPHSFDIRERLSFLTENGIELHTQLVIVSGWNDGEELVKSLDFLTCLKGIVSIGIVPVGITDYRKELTPLCALTPQEAKNLLEIAHRYETHSSVYCADEIFIAASKQIPSADYYGDFPQIENGIGMVRLLLDNWEKHQVALTEHLKNTNYQYVFVTGVIAAEYIRQITRQLNKIAGEELARTAVVINHFLGETVTVTGLLSFKDILDQVEMKTHEIMVVPSSLFNAEGYSIDGRHLHELREVLQARLLVLDELLEEWQPLEIEQ
ncbi:MAG: DUF512 domain-containing protein [Candidatus Cloacimonetes bacterium]|nr:DUF512 domain-containing protein [Candidatus Cloacimonadota bacterium]